MAATATKHADWDRAKAVASALDRVVGIDLNDHACALARTRLIMTAAELAGVTELADAARFHPHIYWADGLEQIEREENLLWRKHPKLRMAVITRSEDEIIRLFYSVGLNNCQNYDTLDPVEATIAGILDHNTLFRPDIYTLEVNGKTPAQFLTEFIAGKDQQIE